MSHSQYQSGPPGGSTLARARAALGAWGAALGRAQRVLAGVRGGKEPVRGDWPQGAAGSPDPCDLRNPEDDPSYAPHKQ